MHLAAPKDCESYNRSIDLTLLCTSETLRSPLPPQEGFP